MRIRVLWSDGRQREVEIHSMRELDRFVGWHMQEGNVDLRTDGDGFELVVTRPPLPAPRTPPAS